MADLYFEELQIGSRSAAGPYLLSKDEIIRFAKQYDPSGLSPMTHAGRHALRSRLQLLRAEILRATYAARTGAPVSRPPSTGSTGGMLQAS
jgi:hypothetical protein